MRRSADLGPCQQEFNYTYRTAHSPPRFLLGIWIPIYSSWIAIELRQAGLERHRGAPGYALGLSQLEPTPVSPMFINQYTKVDSVPLESSLKRSLTALMLAIVNRGWGQIGGSRKTKKAARVTVWVTEAFRARDLHNQWKFWKDRFVRIYNWERFKVGNSKKSDKPEVLYRLHHFASANTCLIKGNE